MKTKNERMLVETRRRRVAQLLYSDLKSPIEIEQELGCTKDMIGHDIRALRENLQTLIHSEKKEYFLDHVNKLWEMEKTALAEYLSASQPSFRLKWHSARLDCLREIGRVIGAYDAHASFAYDDGNKRFIVKLGTFS